MGLKEKIKDFNLRDNEGIDKDDNNGKISEAFKPIAETILSGHFKVTKNNSDSYVTVHPTCVEMYYHEEGEGEDKIKDYIVYHRDSNDGKNKKDIFPLGVLHNHVSGIDLTFEREGNDHEPIRFSALITLNPQLHSRSATYIKRNGLLIRKTAIKSSHPFQCAYYPLTHPTKRLEAIRNQWPSSDVNHPEEVLKASAYAWLSV
ncbi:hypothetical protein [Bacteroides salyersiae]|uniref:hypothetical protein n=1 Tax=Bacteroides salyersiae TaxID=291644 RepID=UPI00189EF5C9|nr:hypothetical protein [Bacteroides salyersiae]